VYNVQKWELVLETKMALPSPSDFIKLDFSHFF
jgi:hypothetical protein